MKQGRTFEALATELRRQAAAKIDLVHDRRCMSFETTPAADRRTVPVSRISVASRPQMLALADPAPLIQLDGYGPASFVANDLFHTQLADRLDIPKRYYDRMQVESPALLDANVNEWLHRTGPAAYAPAGAKSTTTDRRFMVRTLDGTARALLSDRFHRLDHYDLVTRAIIPALTDLQNGDGEGLRIESCEVTDRRLYIKVVTPRLTADVGLNDLVMGGFVISNSETGNGSLSVQRLVYRLVCLNGMIVPDHSLRASHVGRQVLDVGALAQFSDDTNRATDTAFWMQVRDVVANTVERSSFESIVNDFANAKGDAVEGSTVGAVQVLGQQLGLSDAEHDAVLESFIRNADATRFGLVNAVTFAAQNVTSYDRATEMERMGGEVLTLAPDKWRAVANAAAPKTVAPSTRTRVRSRRSRALATA